MSNTEASKVGEYRRQDIPRAHRLRPRRVLLVHAIGLSFLVLTGATLPAQEEEKKAPKPIAILGATVYPVASAPIEDGVVVLRGSRIESVGPRSAVAVPDDALVIEAEGQSLIPGLVHIASGILAERAASESRATQTFQALADALDPQSRAVPLLQREGVTTVGLVPGIGRGTGGLGHVVKLNATGSESRFRELKSLAFLSLELGRVQATFGGELTTTGNRLSQYYSLRALFRKARRYQESWTKYREAVVKFNAALKKWKASKEKAKKGGKPGASSPPRAGKKPAGKPPEKKDGAKKGLPPGEEALEAPKDPPPKKPAKPSGKPPGKGASGSAKKKPTPAPKAPPRPRVDESLEVILRTFGGELPVWVIAHRRDDIEYAVRLKEEFDLELTLVGATEGYRQGKRLKAAKIPVVVSPILLRQRELLYQHHRESNAAQLSTAGIAVSIANFDSDIRSARRLRWHAAAAVRGGLSPELALKAITLEAAERLGVAKEVGSLEAGKQADLILLEGRPLDALSKIRRVIVDGKTVHASRRAF